MGIAGFGTNLHFRASARTGAQCPPTPHQSWTGSHWLVALLPGTFFGLTNFAQNTAIAGGFAGPLPFLVVFVLFLIVYNAFAMILRVAWEVPALISTNAEVNEMAACLHLVVVVGGGSLQLLGIATLTAAIRNPTNWVGSLANYFSEIAISCAPVWIFAYLIANMVLDLLFRHRSVAAGFESPARLELRAGGQTVYVRVDEITLLEAQGNYVRVVTAGRSLMSRTSLSAMEAALPRGLFVRTHRSAIVRKALITEIQRSDTGAYSAVLRDETVAPVSRRRLSAVRKAILGGRLDGTVVTTS